MAAWTWGPACSCCGFTTAGCTANITLTAFINGGGPNSAAAHLAANPAKPPAPINTLDTILILRLEDGADSFISIHGAFLPSCFAMDLDALLTLGSSPVLAVESLGEAGEKLLQQGLARPEGLTGLGQQAEAEADLLGMQVGELGITSSSSAVAAAGCTVSPSGVEDRVPKEVQRLVSFLRVSVQQKDEGVLLRCWVPVCCGSGWVDECRKCLQLAKRGLPVVCSCLHMCRQDANIDWGVL